MNRKIVQQGIGGFTVYLPAKWVKKNHLGKGDDIQIDESENRLLISAKKKEFKRETEIKLKSSEETSIRTLVTSTYRLGYHKVKVNFNSEEEFKLITKTIKNLMGFEITSRENSQCVIESVTEPDNTQIDNIFLRQLFMISELLKNTRSMLDGEDTFEYIQEMQERMAKFDNFCRRVASKESELRAPATIMWAFYMALWRSQREIYWLAKYLNNNRKIKISAEIKDHYSRMMSIFESIKKGYIKKDIAPLEKIHESEKQLIYEEGYKLAEKMKGKEIVVFHRLLAATRNFYLTTSPLIGILLWNSE